MTDAKSKRAVSDDVTSAIRILEWARLKGFRIGPILEVGSVRMQVVDLKQEKIGALDMGPEQTVEEMYGAMGEPAPGTTG